MEREFHAVAELFPLLRGAAFEELVADIQNNGLREPILCDAEGRIVDGRNRYRACLQAGVEPRFFEWQGEGSLEELSLSLNLRRRHLNESQRAMVAARVARLMGKDATKRKGVPREKVANLRPSQFGKSCGKAADLVNVSARLISHAIKVLRDGGDNLIAAVESGQLAVSAAATLAGLPKDEQARVVEGGAKEAARRVRELRTADRAEPALQGRFGVVCVGALEPDAVRQTAGEDPIVFLWLPSGGLPVAIDVLKKGGFRFVPASE